MTEWLIENRDWLGTAVPCFAVTAALIFWVLSGLSKDRAHPFQDKPNTLSFTGDKRTMSVIKVEITNFITDNKRVTV
jgi:hypothetical protein